MINYFKKQMNRYFDKTLAINVKVFHMLMFIAIVAGLLAALSGFLTVGRLIPVVALDASLAALAFVLLRIAEKRKCYRLMSLIFVVLAFFILFPTLFFTGGANRNGMDKLFVIAIISTVVLFEGKERIAIVAAQFVAYAACFAVAYYKPELIGDMAEGAGHLYFYLTNFALVCAIVAVIVLMHRQVIKNRQEHIEELSRELEHSDETSVCEAGQVCEGAQAQTQKVGNGTASATTVITLGAGEIALDIVEKRAYVNGRNVKLTPKEFAVFWLLAQNEDREISNEQIIEKVWGDQMYYDVNSVRVCISRLRKKLDEEKATNFAIFTSYGQGYTFTTFSGERQ